MIVMEMKIACCLLLLTGFQVTATQIELWRMENGDAIPIDYGVSFTKLESTQHYVISAEVPRSGYFAVFYWMGEKSNRAYAQLTVAHAIHLYRFLPEKPMHIFREVEGEESCFFKNLFANRELVENFVTKAVDQNVVNKNRLFLIGGFEDDYRFKEVKPGLVNALNISGHCLVFLAKKTYIYCGEDSILRQREEAAVMAEMFSSKIGRSPNEEIAIHKSHPRDAEKLKEFFEELVASSKAPQDDAVTQRHTSKEILVEQMKDLMSEPQPAKDKDGWSNISIKVEKITLKNTGKGYKVEPRLDNSVRTAPPETENCYLIDTQSDFGLFVWMGKECDFQHRKSIAEAAETSSKKRGYKYRTPIIFVDEGTMPYQDVSFKTLMKILKPSSYFRHIWMNHSLPGRM